MGFRSKAKKIKQLLPIVGAGGNVRKKTEIGPDASVRAEAVRAPVPVAPPAPQHPRGSADPQSYIASVVKENPVVLFMKGSPGQPMCGFSANAVGILQSYGKGLHHVDILMDPEVRQGVKEYSNWPTIPQVYVGGEFLGGSDILMQMHEQGELGSLIESACASK
jgi:monothiol glutaredoxin